MLRLSKAMETLVRQAAAQELQEPMPWLEALLMPERESRVSKDAYLAALRLQNKSLAQQQRQRYLKMLNERIETSDPV